MPVIPWWMKALGALGLLAAVVIGFKIYIASERADERKEVLSEVKDREQQAEIKDLKSALAEAKKRADITETRNDELSQSLRSGRAERDAYVERMRRAFVAAAQRAGQAGMASAPGQSFEADQATFVDDVAICEENTKRLINARDWYEDQRKVKPE